MSDVLLKELTNADIDWLVTNGERRSLIAAEVLIRAAQPLEAFYLLLEGNLTVRADSMADSLADSIADSPTAIDQLFRGDVIGEGGLFDIDSAFLVAATDKAMVLAIPKALLLQKLQQDISFAAHFYRAIALILSEQIRGLFEHSDLMRYQSGQMVKEALFVFGELRDSDIDWMLAAGKLEKLAAGRVLLNAGRPVDALYTVLDGQLAIATTDHPCDPLSTCSHGLEELGATQNFKPIAYLSRGGLPGITSFLDFQPLPVRFQAVRESLLLAIPRQQVAIKLQEDLGFAARFYRVMATQLSHLLTAIAAVGEMSHAKDMKIEIENELNLDQLQRVSQGAMKFDWMLKHLGVGV